MESFLSRFKNALVLIAILLAQTIALATQINRPVDAKHPDGAQTRLVRLWAAAAVSPFERASHALGHGVGWAWSDYVDLRHVRRQNGDLRRELDQLKLRQAAMAEDVLEAQRLRGLLAFRQSFAATTVVAEVIGTSGTDQSRLLTLDKGARDGLKPDMAVITPNGIVGKLREVFPTTSQLLLINDPTSGAGVILSSTRIHAVLRGSAQGRVQITNLMPDSRIKAGETVLTSGGDGVYPRGLPVGVIEGVRQDPDHQPFALISIRPATNLSQLDEVLVVMSTASLEAQNQTAEQQDLAADPLTHAADVSAEKLPSLHEEKPAVAGEVPPANDSTDLVPKPKAAVHADKYSPGSAAPAAELMPGGRSRDSGSGSGAKVQGEVPKG
jgi:rod shape-determining protein MreC